MWHELNPRSDPRRSSATLRGVIAAASWCVSAARWQSRVRSMGDVRGRFDRRHGAVLCRSCRVQLARRRRRRLLAVTGSGPGRAWRDATSASRWTRLGRGLVGWRRYGAFMGFRGHCTVRCPPHRARGARQSGSSPAAVCGREASVQREDAPPVGGHHPDGRRGARRRRLLPRRGHRLLRLAAAAAGRGSLGWRGNGSPSPRRGARRSANPATR